MPVMDGWEIPLEEKKSKVLLQGRGRLPILTSSTRPQRKKKKSQKIIPAVIAYIENRLPKWKKFERIKEERMECLIVFALLPGYGNKLKISVD